MKFKIFPILLLMLLLTGTYLLKAQCTVQPYTMGGIYPGQGEPIHPAAATGFYDLQVTVVIPYDTVIPPFPRLPIDSANVKEFIGFPTSFQFDYLPAAKWIKGDSSGCIRISGIPATQDVGVHSISLVYTVVILGFAYTDTVENWWSFEVKTSQYVGHQEIETVQDGFSIYPNPCRDQLVLTPQKEGACEITLFSMTGQEVLHLKSIFKPYEPFLIPTDDFEPGIYLMKITSNEGILNRKLIISH
jgi:hypothetical protein